MAAALRFKHDLHFFRALELLGHGKTHSVKSARNSGFPHGAWSKGTVPTLQLAKLVGERVGGGVGEAPNSPTCLGAGTAGKGLKGGWPNSNSGRLRRVLSLLGSLERQSGVALPVEPSSPLEPLARARIFTNCALN